MEKRGDINPKYTPARPAAVDEVMPPVPGKLAPAPKAPRVGWPTSDDDDDATGAPTPRTRKESGPA